MANKTFDLDDYISQRKEKDPEFAKDFDDRIEEELQNFFKPLLEKTWYRGCAKSR